MMIFAKNHEESSKKMEKVAAEMMLHRWNLDFDIHKC